ncbi:histidine-type phosphatase [Erwiniaceae bacterium BAC15a-03b]|uniref:Histidine-type phosphatase n=1 Tax=Winslowiella arboricola TaxID=2978220 RepID=A0A9J6PK84_9GAMM|nr:histidine-type phosphatase [Winslowiella arboricola]MCU5772048.1 histidine-type phosphatase [Winslowiella arboricola]MCU5776120.1 histidine-type phosphatase [Winslowiella arboricola]
MLINQTAALRLFFTGLLVLLSTSVGAQPHYVLEKVVEISRHGVRPPTPSNTQAMAAGTARQWPQWLTADGELTGHGYSAAVIKGQYNGSYYRQYGLLTRGCPDNGTLFVWASPLQRTKATAKALTDGAFPGCGVPIHSMVAKDDPLFQSDKMALAKLDAAKARAAILHAMGGSVAAAEQRLAAETARLKQAVCQAAQPCPAFDQPWQVKQEDDGRFTVSGLSTLANMAETFRLAWSENQPLAQVAFGQVHSASEIAALMPLLTAKYDFTSDVPYIARRGGSILMDQISKALQQGIAPQHNAPPDVRWLLYVAHDTNISYLRTMLNFSWQLGNYPRGNIPPASSLVFERWRDSSSGKRFIRIYFQAQTLDQIRTLQTIDVRHPQLRQELTLQGCQLTAVGMLCPYDAAIKRIAGSIDRTAVSKVDYSGEE